MEPMGTFFYEEWQSLSKMFFTDGNNVEGDFFSPSHTLNCNLDYFSQDTSIDSNGSDGMFFVNNTSHEYVQQNNCDVTNLLQVTNNNPDESIDFYMMGNNNLENSYDDCIMKEMVCMKEDIGNNHLDNEMLLKRKFDKVELQSVIEDQKFKELENPKKKSRVSREGPKNKKNAKPKVNKNQEKTKINNEEVGEQEINNAVCQSGQSTSSCSSEDDSNVSHELNGSTNSDTKSNLNGKSRACRGAATDPQSLYARRRREKINERLRILQTLVPNGTKVDISTMLEEAVHYVKFLQIQIKLLSSDDMWMYAPVAYNGMELASLIPSL